MITLWTLNCTHTHIQLFQQEKYRMSRKNWHKLRANESIKGHFVWHDVSKVHLGKLGKIGTKKSPARPYRK